jgi:ubiquitin-protein ligase E3 C
MSNLHTFTGSSRKPRNINLSGQPSSINPFALGPGGNPARTVTKAQAERQQRQRERDRAQAAKKIQGAFRCYRAGQTANDLRRERFDRTYARGSPASRIESCLPLLLRFHKLKNVDDIRRLQEICDDIVTVGVPSLDCLATAQIQQLICILLDRLPLASVATEQNVALLHLIVLIIKTSKKAAGGPAKYHYRSLVRLVQASLRSEAWVQALAEAALAPLQALEHVEGKLLAEPSLPTSWACILGLWTNKHQIKTGFGKFIVRLRSIISSGQTWTVSRDKAPSSHKAYRLRSCRR